MALQKLVLVGIQVSVKLPVAACDVSSRELKQIKLN